MLFTALRFPVVETTGLTDTVIGTETTELMDNSDRFFFVSDMAYPETVMTFNLEGTTATYDDITDIQSGSAYEPFGTVATMDVGDALFLHPSRNTAPTTFHRIYVRVATPGVGSYSIGIKRYNATTDAWETQTISQDTTNNFKTSGVGFIDFTSATHGATRLQQQDTSKEYWTKIEVATLTSVTTAPVIDAIWFQTSGSGANLYDTVAVGSRTIITSIVFITGASYYLAISPSPVRGWNVISKSADVNPVTMKWQYYNSSGTWVNLPMLRDETGGFDDVSTNAAVRWSIPSDWASTALTLVDDTTGDTHTSTGYLHRLIPVSSTVALVQDNGNSALHFVPIDSTHTQGIPVNAGTLDYLTYAINGAISSTAVSLGVANTRTGQMSTATIAANRRTSFADTNRRLELANLTFAEDDELVIYHLSGGTLTDCELRLHST